jgi:hypothetical protein
MVVRMVGDLYMYVLLELRMHRTRDSIQSDHV